MTDFGDFITTGDHARGCAGREYACTCGYDDAKDSEILRLRGELAALREPAGEGLVEVAARRLAAVKMGLVNDPNGEGLPDVLWRQAVPQARAALARAEGAAS